MWANRVFSIAVVFFCLAACLSAADVRTWTDTSGKTMEGKLLKVTPDGEAVISSNGKVFPIPITRFSAADQAYINAFSENGSETQDSPDDAPDEPKRTRKPRRDDLFDFREWTNTDGLTIKARYVRIHEGLIVLMQGKKGVQAPFDKLSAEDQEFLRTHLEERGEADQLPVIQPRSPEGIASGESSGPSFPGPGPGMPSQLANNSAPSFPSPQGQAYFPQPETPAYDPTGTGTEEAGRTEPAEPQPPSFQPPDLAMHEPSVPPSGPSFQPPDHSRHTDELKEMSQQRRDKFYNEITTSVCSNCNKEVPDHIGAGDNCPNCGVYIEYEENHLGQKTYAANQPNQTNGQTQQTTYRWRRRSGIGVAIAILVGIIRFGMKALKS